MHIKEITISGFKSYRDETKITNLSKKHNVIVGRNGTGKSSLFSAIRFVLGDAYGRIGHEERQALIYEESGPSPISSFVEIVFDNSDGRCPTGKETVVLRRTIGMKKDEYILDNRTISKADVMNLLQSAGFSKANPYYIVPQGRVTSLTNAKDHERLQLLKEVAGTSVYEEHREESHKILNETKKKNKKIEELMKATEERIAELEEDQKELLEYTAVEEECRSLEHAIYKRQIDEATEEIEQLKDIPPEDSQFTELEDKEAEKRTIEDKLRQKKYEEDVYLLERKEIERDIDEHKKEKLLLETKQTEIEKKRKQQNVAKRIVEEVKKKIEEKEKRLLEIYEKLEENKEEEVLCLKDAELKEFEQERLMKRKRGDMPLGKSQIMSLEKELKEKRKKLEEIKNEHNQLLEEEASIQSIEKQNQRENVLSNLAAERKNASKKQETVTEERKRNWRIEVKMEGVVASAKDEIFRLERNLPFNRDVLSTIQTMEGIVREEGIPGVYGALYTLFDAEDVYWNAIESVCGNSLFGVVVDSDETASLLVKKMTKCNGGRLTFIPLNRIKKKECSLEETETAFPLIRKLKYRQEFENVFQHFFSDVFLVPSVSFGSSFARKNKMQAVTMEGDISTKKGVLCGGYTKKDGSILSCCLRIAEWKERHRLATEQLISARQIIKECSNRLAELAGQQKMLEHKQRSLQTDRHETETTRQTQHKNKVARIELEKEIDLLVEKKQIAENERRQGKTDFVEKDKETLLANAKTISEIKEKLDTIQRKQSALNTEKQQVTNALRINLRKRVAELKVEKEETETDCKEQNDRIALFIKEAEETVKIIDRKIVEIKESRHRNKTDLKVLVELIDEKRKQTEEKDADRERAFFKRAVIKKRRDELTQKIRSLGLINEQNKPAHSHLANSQLLTSLYTAKKKLETYQNINRTATEQYSAFVKQRDALNTRKKELDKSEQSIDQFLEVLELQKSETIEKTFEQVSSNFSKTWKKLVPNGNAELKINKTKTTGKKKSELTPSSEFTGVEVQVSFHALDFMSIKQLSGGQKSLVALALIFSIQLCDPAPFYLFDEVDANLDAAHRVSVSNLIHEMSQTAQFITTTFRQELLGNAEMFYGVSLVERSSTAMQIDKKLAHQFVEHSQAIN